MIRHIHDASQAFDISAASGWNMLLPAEAPDLAWKRALSQG
jgi:hypothetical protein